MFDVLNEVTETAKDYMLCRCVLLLICLLLLCALAAAQGNTADILGTITDPSGAVVPNAKIVITDNATHETHTVTSNSSGEYVAPSLPSGEYSIRVEASGFQTASAKNVRLEAGSRLRQNFSMAIGNGTETVQVSGETPALETDTSTLSSVVTERQVEELPLNGRNFVQLAQLAAGANEGPANALSAGNRPDDRRQTASVSVYGQSDTLNNELVDGLDNNEKTIGTIGIRPSVEAIAEFRVQTNVYPAEVGNSPGAVVNVITKSGGNTLHGSAYEFVRNDMFDGRNYFARSGRKPEYRQNQFGASLGGPIRKDKTFFFGDYEGLRIIQGTTYVSTVPTLFEQQNIGNLSDIGGPVLTSGQLNPIALKYFALYPAPNGTGVANNFTFSPNGSQNSQTFDLRGDNYFSERDHFFARYTFNTVSTVTPDSLPAVNGVSPGGSAASFPGTAQEGAQQLLFGHTHTFGANKVLELRAGYTRINNQSLPVNNGSNLGNKFGIVNANFNSFTTALSNVSITGYSGFGNSTFLPIIDLDNVFQEMAAMTITRGHHTFKFGADLIRRQIENQQNTSGTGSFSFTTSPTKFALANFLQGNPFTVSRGVQFTARYFRTWEPEGYIQDDWRVKPWLTLNLGLRYDVFTPDTDAHDAISIFNPATASVQVAGQNGVSDSAGIKTDYGSIAPRIGFAASVTPNTVVRGGFGMVYFRDNTGPSSAYLNPPFVTTYAPNPLTTSLSTPLPLPVPGSTTALSGALSGMQLNYKDSYVEQFNLNVEHSFGGTVATVGYVGNLGRRLRIRPDINLAPPSPVPFATRRPFFSVLPNVTGIQETSSEGYSNYNGFQSTLQRRFSHGLTASANYTWSHSIADFQSYSNGGSYVSAVTSQYATLERGNSDQDLRHRFSMLLNYALPFGANLTGWKAGFLKGWQFNAIDVWETGTPFSVLNSSPRSNTGVSSDRPNQLGDATLSNPSIHEWFNTAMFQAQTLGTIGSERRNPLYGPHFRHFDAAVAKEFKITERYTLQARVESFNLSNTPNFGLPSASVGTSSFGTISSQRIGSTPRQFQGALRLTF